MTSCRSCRTPIGGDQQLCDRCFAASLTVRLGTQSAARPVVRHWETTSVALGAAGAAMAAVIGVVLWYGMATGSGHSLTVMSVIVGWLVGVATLKGGGRGATALAVLSATTTLGALVVTQYLLARFDVHGPLLADASTMAGMVRTAVAAHPKDLLWWGVALVSAWYIPSRRLA